MYMYIIYVYVCVYIYIYIYTCIQRERERDPSKEDRHFGSDVASPYNSAPRNDSGSEEIRP